MNNVSRNDKIILLLAALALLAVSGWSVWAGRPTIGGGGVAVACAIAILSLRRLRASRR